MQLFIYNLLNVRHNLLILRFDDKLNASNITSLFVCVQNSKFITVISCPDATGGNSNLNVDKDDYTIVDNSATYSCDNGYELNGVEENTCIFQDDSLVWEQDIPTCNSE